MCIVFVGQDEDIVPPLQRPTTVSNTTEMYILFTIDNYCY